MTHNPEHPDVSSGPRTDPTPQAESPERGVIRSKDTLRPSKDEVNFLSTASPLIGRCLASYDNEKSLVKTGNDFETCIRSTETVSSVLDLSQYLLDREDFLRT